ncbi:low molecular weight phosphatase family protein [Arthrobacter sp. B0490]|uniref:arsenate reductase/protein-tyrosine-phosphatase family protein n=1 Tax=Arthrobacter sp. B0490 TaxID=2058891 RepID=UPI002157FE0F|nr:low molecular weight phosphatase family protein [Arthrobacter sp. B0490]
MVCTGNICRSPMAERLLQAQLDQRFPGQFIVESAGTGALVGSPIDPLVAAYIRDLGGNSDSFSARQLVPEILANKDLVLALTREHRSKIVEMSPALLRRVFTIRQLSQLLNETNPDVSLTGAARWRAALPMALRARSRDLATTPEMWDVVDPYRRGNVLYQQMRAELAPAVERLGRFG